MQYKRADHAIRSLFYLICYAALTFVQASENTLTKSPRSWKIWQRSSTSYFDVLVGVNLLREGLDLPEVSTVAILDADKEGFLRSETSLIQTIGRTARNINAKVFLYADVITKSMQKAIDETERRRKIQLEYNREHNITPETIRKEIRNSLTEQLKAKQTAQKAVKFDSDEYEKVELTTQIEKEMLEAAQNLDFERAAFLRDQLKELKELPELVLMDSKRKRRDFLATKKIKRKK